jgi:adenine-specific DNA-methyltransferase
MTLGAPMADRRRILQTLTREHLLDLAGLADIAGLTGRVKADIIDTLVASRAVTLESILETLSRDQLKTACRDLGLDDTGREKQVLIDRLLQRHAPRPAAQSVGNGPGSRPANGGRRAGEGLPVEDYRHEGQTRKNIPPAQIAAEGTVPAVPKVAYTYSPRRPPVLRSDPTGRADDLPELLAAATRRPLRQDEALELAQALRVHEPWLEWAGKREQHQRGGFTVDPVALQIHERVSAQAILRVAARLDIEPTLFGDPQQAYHEAVQFYRHDVGWTNRLILGDSLQVMASLASREDLAGKVQMIYMDPPYGIKFGSNFQPEVGRRDVRDRERDLTREAEVVKAYRDTWHLGVHSYLGYLRTRLLAARQLLSDTGSLFVQISDDNLHGVRQIMDEVFGRHNFCSIIPFSKTSGATPTLLPTVCDFLLWYARDKRRARFRDMYEAGTPIDNPLERYICVETDSGDIVDLSVAQKLGTSPMPHGRLLRLRPTDSQGESDDSKSPVECHGKQFFPPAGRHWSVKSRDLRRAVRAGLIHPVGHTLTWKAYRGETVYRPTTNNWTDISISGFGAAKAYVVQTLPLVVERCLLMTTDPGDLVVDPTCGSGTTAYVAEQWGRRWITIDTSRVAIAIARQRLLTARYEYYKLRPVAAGDREKNPTGAWLSDPEEQIDGQCTFWCKTFPYITLRSIAQNTNLDPILARQDPILDARLADCNAALTKVSGDLRSRLVARLLEKQKRDGKRGVADADYRRWELPKRGQKWEHWEVPFDTDPDWPKELQETVAAYRKAWRGKMDEVNDCIAANAEHEELVDQPDIVRGILRVSGPFTVESVQPPEGSLGHVEEHEDEGFDGAPSELEGSFGPAELDAAVHNVEAYLTEMIRLLRTDGVRFPDNRQMRFRRLDPVTGSAGIHAEGRWTPEGHVDADREGKADVAVAFGPQYGPVTAKQVEELIRSASRRGYDHLVIAGFSFDGAAQAIIEEQSHPSLRIHITHIRPDVNPGMAGLLKEQPGSQLFSVFGRPRSKPTQQPDGNWIVRLDGVDIYDPVTNTISSSGASKVAAWFLDGDYDGRTFCITQAFFPNPDAWDKLARALSASNVIDPSVFEALSGTTSLPFPAGQHRRVAVKVIDPRGNEVMQVHRLG